MISNGCQMLVIASIDGSSWASLFPRPRMQATGYFLDRPDMNSDAVSYYATFDNYKVGQKQENTCGGAGTGKCSRTKEYRAFTGDPADNNCVFSLAAMM
ncbi:hypothetical protein [Enterocloster sp.]|uniref:hypothetical protein n=1 Tax=Enterocloster sp. TaxID=2719315 RepID=UPI0039A08247